MFENHLTNIKLNAILQQKQKERNLKMKKISARNAAELKTRTVWTFCPVERVKQSKKVYNRQKWKRVVAD